MKKRDIDTKTLPVSL